MYAQTDNPQVQARLRSQIHEGERNINYLTEQLKTLELKARTPPNRLSGGPSPTGGPPSGYGRGNNGAPLPPPKDLREPMENGRGYDAYGQRPWQQPGPPIPVKSRQYTKLGKKL
jgi:hypothetical protein